MSILHKLWRLMPASRSEVIQGPVVHLRSRLTLEPIADFKASNYAFIALPDTPNRLSLVSRFPSGSFGCPLARLQRMPLLQRANARQVSAVYFLGLHMAVIAWASTFKPQLYCSSVGSSTSCGLSDTMRGKSPAGRPAK